MTQRKGNREVSLRKAPGFSWPQEGFQAAGLGGDTQPESSELLSGRHVAKSSGRTGSYDLKDKNYCMERNPWRSAEGPPQVLSRVLNSVHVKKLPREGENYAKGLDRTHAVLGKVPVPTNHTRTISSLSQSTQKGLFSVVGNN